MEVLFCIIALGLIASFLALFLKSSQMPILAVLVSLVAGVAILLKIIPSITQVFGEINSVAKTTGLRMDYIPLLLKVVAVSYIGEFAQELCNDAGESGIAKKVELGVKIIIMIMALPLLKAILQTVLELLK